MRNYSSVPTHSYHLVEISPWPILISFSVLSGALAVVSWLTLGEKNKKVNIKLIINFVFILFNWLRDVVREGLGGFHTIKVKKGLMLGFILFLITEVLLFASMFWCYLHSSLNPSVEIVNWPPLGINAVNYLSLPLLNSILLISGGFVCTWAHHSFLKGDKTNTLFGKIKGMTLTIIFLFVQYIEFSYSEFTISDSVYGSSFFIITGLHSFHVICAVLFLMAATYRIYSDSITSEHALILDCSLIYYH